MEKLTKNNLKKVLIISPNWIGDSIMAEPLFSHLKKGQFEDLNSFLREKTFVKDQDIIIQGTTEVSMPMYIIKSGEVWCSISDELGNGEDAEDKNRSNRKRPNRKLERDHH